VQKIYIYILVFLIGSSNSFFQQFYKLPVLFQHYMEHQQHDDIDFVKYLSMHYWGQDDNDNDQERDMQLPFKKIDLHTAQLVFVPLDRPVEFPSCPVILKDQRPIIYKPTFHTNPALACLFRPPSA